MTRTEIVMATIAYAVPCIVAVVLWVRLQIAWRHLQRIRQVAEENAAYRPDDLIDSPAGATFERASRYWSNLIMRVVPPSR